MDDRRFDDLAKLFATGFGTRRAALRLAATGVVGALLGRLGLEDVAAGCTVHGKACSGDGQCCSRFCERGGKCTEDGKRTGKCTCRCRKGTKPCGNKDCCGPKQECKGGRCVAKETEPSDGGDGEGGEPSDGETEEGKTGDRSGGEPTCREGTTPCGTRACCGPKQECKGGRCVAKETEPSDGGDGQTGGGGTDPSDGQVSNAATGTCSGQGQSCTTQKCCRGYTCLVDATSGTEKFCCPTPQVCGQCCVPTGGICQNKKCLCSSGKTRCTSTSDPIGTCRNLQTGVNNCGRCGHKCPGPANNQPCGKAACVAGVCTIVPDETKTGNVCRQKAGPCDVEETCNGKIPECPPDVFRPATEICRQAQGECEKNAFCSGDAAACPENPLLPDTTVCREAAGDCDVPEFCTGTSNQCPTNQFQLNGTPCNRDNNLCTLDTCQDGVCQGGPQKTCPASTDPCKVNVCDPVTGNCVTRNATNGTPCEDGNLCTLLDTCQNGTCRSGTAKTCPTSTDLCKVNVCDPTTGNCVAQNAPNNTPCETGNLCTLDTCQNGVCAQGAVNVTCPVCQACDPTTGTCKAVAKGTTCGLCAECNGGVCQTCSQVQKICCPAGSAKANRCSPNLNSCGA